MINMETQKAPPKNKCPFGHKFDLDCDAHDDCEDCNVFEECEYVKHPPSKPIKPMPNRNDNMKKETITKQIDMEETFKQLRAMLTCDKFIITGSQALKVYGLITKADDIDIILVNPSVEVIDRLKKLQEEMPAATKAQFDSESYKDHSLLAIFKWNGIKVDVFDSTGEPTLNINGFEYAMIPNIVEAKLEANRLKDWLQLRKIAASIWSREAMAKWLDAQEKKV